MQVAETDNDGNVNDVRVAMQVAETDKDGNVDDVGAAGGLLGGAVAASEGFNPLTATDAGAALNQMCYLRQ